MLKYRVEQRPEHPLLQEVADMIADDYFEVVLQGVNAHERSNQVLIGPSEIGEECQRALVHKLAKDPEPNKAATLWRGWKPAVGTALHSQMEAWFKMFRAGDAVVENRVAVGMIGPDIIEGSSDLFYLSGAVVDHKFIGKKQLDGYKANGPGQKYRKQAHLYGRGFKLKGQLVQIVMIFFVPRDGELKDAYVWWEPFDEQVALDTLAHANRLHAAIQAFGKDTVLQQFPLCQNHDEGDENYNKDADWCDWCTPARNAEAAALAGNPFSFK